MRLAIRWGLAAAISVAAFVVAWWACQEGIGLDRGTALGVAGAVLAVVLAVTAWWAARERPSADSGAASWWVVQKVRGGRDVNVAGRDQTITSHGHRDE